MQTWKSKTEVGLEATDPLKKVRQEVHKSSFLVRKHKGKEESKGERLVMQVVLLLTSSCVSPFLGEVAIE